MFYVYVLKSVGYNNRYIGSTADISRRVDKHNRGKCRYTKGRKPWKLVYCEKFDTLGIARKRELFLKTGKGRELLDEIIISDKI